MGMYNGKLLLYNSNFGVDNPGYLCWNRNKGVKGEKSQVDPRFDLHNYMESLHTWFKQQIKGRNNAILHPQ
jgi:hypothetical protein